MISCPGKMPGADLGESMSEQATIEIGRDDLWFLMMAFKGYFQFFQESVNDFCPEPLTERMARCKLATERAEVALKGYRPEAANR